MLKTCEINQDELKKVVGGTTTEDFALGRTDEYPLFLGYTADNHSISATNYQGQLFDANGNEYRWSSFDNAKDGSYTILYFTSLVGNNVYSKIVNASDNSLPFLWSPEHFIF